MSSLARVAPLSRAVASSSLANVPSARSSKSSGSAAASTPTTGHNVAQGTAVAETVNAMTSSAPGATHVSAAGTSSSLDAAKSMSPATNALSHATTNATFNRGGATLDVGGLSSAISRPLGDGNGTYTVVVAMHPAELGHVQAVMSLTGNDLQIALSPQTDHGHAALAVAVNDLKNELARGGVNVTIDLRHPQSQTSGDGRRPETPTPHVRVTDRITNPANPSSSTRDAGQIHLML